MMSDEIKQIETWCIMLNSPDFDNNDAGLVRDEMQDFLVNFYKYNILGVRRKNAIQEVSE